MKRRNAILAAVIGIAIVAAAAGGILLMNPGSNTANANNEGSSDIRPTGPDGTVSSVEISTATVNRSGASAFVELRDELNATFNISEVPDTLMKVAVTNNQMDNITLNLSGFVAVLDNDSSVKALNNMSMTVGPNVTVFPVLAFDTNGTAIKSVSYRDGSVSFSVTMTSESMKELPAIVTKEAPTGNMTPVANLTFTDLAAWNITRGRDAPVSLMFNNSSMVLALLTVTNNNTDAVNLNASDFYLDIGNGTWLQGDIGLNNNVPSDLTNNTTVPFLIGFRLGDNMTSNGTVYYWPGGGEQTSKIPLKMMDMTGIPDLALDAMWNSNDTAQGNGTGNDTAANTTMLTIELIKVGNDVSASNITNVTVWTMKAGEMNVTAENGTDNRTLNVTVKLDKDDNVTLLSYSSGNETRYIFLRSVDRV
jgi:hypothetical protein